MNDGWPRRVLLFILAVVLVGVILILFLLSLALPARAHSEAELELWMVEYERMKDQVEMPPWPTRAAPIVLAWDAMLTDMQDRHPCSQALGTWTDVCERSTAPQAKSSSRGMGNNVEQWRGLVASYSWDVDTALCLMAKESGGNPDAQNPSSGASGLMQVLPSWAPVFGYKSSDLFDPVVNLEISYALYVDGGWSHWSPFLRGECRS